jgi:hypothetical protein
MWVQIPPIAEIQKERINELDGYAGEAGLQETIVYRRNQK